MPIRLVIADDHPVVLDGLAQLFASEPDCEVVARATDGDEALAAVREHRPDILVLDLRMPRMDGVAVFREMQREALPTRTVVLTAADNAIVLTAIQLGVHGVVLKDMATKWLVCAVREVYAGGRWIEKGAANHAIGKLLEREASTRGILDTLTPRELEIARMTAKGLHNKVIAGKLAITEGTAKLHLHHVYEKLKVDGRFELVQFLRSSGLENKL